MRVLVGHRWRCRPSGAMVSDCAVGNESHPGNMNKIEAQQRILRNLAVIQFQVKLLNSQGQNISAYSEAVVRDVLIAITGQPWVNLNGLSNNYPALDLLSPDGISGVQATAHTTKAKIDRTVSALKKQLILDPKSLAELSEVQVVGLSCVDSKAVTAWQDVVTVVQTVRVRGVAVQHILDLANRTDRQLAGLDRALQGLASTTPFSISSDRDELKTVISYLDRPAIRHSRHLESNWHDMQEAMRSIRRLLTQGADDSAHTITRPYRTFQPAAAELLKQIYDETVAISTLLRPGLQSPSSMRESDLVLLDGHRRRIQEKVTDLAVGAQLTPPSW